MENYNIVICDRCKKEINIGEDSLKEKKINNDVVKYFECDRCGKKYIYIVEDEFTMLKQNKICKLQKKVERELQGLNEKKVIKYNKDIRKIMKDVTEYQRRIKRKYENF
ncbi:hypothetical protein IRP63_16295 [Clostridium phage CWou-2020a]|uniref:Uncharacterized protein n=1 Tax=Clostridium botulinum C/D str. DC5 TaxID=1443128 RepID=A0A0A0IIP7_CLOBO|nr:hypothetical protein [Clostridium botulinum]QPW59427.1 hypothetical protein IRP63_16295 [Clostridium phage CWou-2020a]KGN00838.1 hypothetical protein Z955_02455 [Clostridium botulinum C/D str. DC5]KOC54179.1 hypothetical protein ADU90_12630 [Clostridium botulinum]KOC56523.1 hypothetical protein ADU89_02640 [Clostridium botulinum]MCD3240907.1 hypothetical protein [Clostridium botulinum D/C]